MAVTEQSTRAKAALDDLYRRHVGDVYRYTYAVLGNHADAEDVTQTTFVNALRALERGEQPRNPSSWLLAIAHNLVRQRWRQAAARPTEIELVGDVPAGVPDEEIELDGLVKALQKIPPAQREALVMRELEGRSYQEIAELLGITTSALETLLFRARRSLADELENIVTCQSAELAMSQQLDGRLSRKDRRRLKEHLDECAACARLAEMQGKQRRAFKGLALLPVPIGLTLFKGAPAASAAIGLPSIGVPSIGVGATGLGGAGAGAGTATTAAGTGAAVGAGASVGAGTTGVTTAGGAAGAGGAAVGGSLVGGAAAKIAAVVVAAAVATGAGYEGIKAVTHSQSQSTPAASQTGQGGAATSPGKSAGAAATTGANGAQPTPPVVAGGVEGAPGQIAQDGLPGERTGWTDEHVDNGVRGEPESQPGHGGSAGAGAQGNDGATADKPVKDEPQGGQSTAGTTVKTTAKSGAVERTTGPRPRDFETGKPAIPGQPTTPQTGGNGQGQGGQEQGGQGQGGGNPQPNGGSSTDPKGQGGADGTTGPSSLELGPSTPVQAGQGKGGKDTETG
jgi:RNA polymerase sigma factor (sigma-70 family)